MSIVRRNNLVFPSLMSEILKPDWFGGIENMNSNIPSVNIKENDKDFEIELAVPGRKKNDFNIEIESNVLTISSEVNSDKKIVEENYTRREFGLSSFKRAFTLPKTIDEAQIKAEYNNGILSFKLPKRKESLPKPKRLIELK